MDIRSKLMIAQAINDQPEFLTDQIGLLRSDTSTPNMAEALQQIADYMEEFCER